MKSKIVATADIQAIVKGGRVHYWNEGPLTVIEVCHRTDPETGCMMVYGILEMELPRGRRRLRLFALSAGEHYTPGFGVTP